MSRRRVVALVAGPVALAVAVVVAVTVLIVRAPDDVPPGPAAPPAPPTLADLAAEPVALAREPFCTAVDAAAIAAALGAEPSAQDDYRNGDRVELAPGVADVAHEHGCSWTGPDGAVLRAWVFAPPVTPARGRRLGAQVSGTAGCAPYAETGFGQPSVAWTCTPATGPVTVGRAGLFGDAWLTCTVTGGTTATPLDLQERTDDWCAAVGTAAAAR